MAAGDTHGALLLGSKLERCCSSRVEAQVRVILRVHPALATSHTIRDLTSRFTRRQDSTCARHTDLSFPTKLRFSSSCTSGPSLGQHPQSYRHTDDIPAWATYPSTSQSVLAADE